MCQTDTVNTQYTHLCRLLHISKFMRFLGGPSWPNICVWGTKCNFKDWEKFAPWDLEERRTDLEGQRHRTSRSHSAASRLVLYLGAGDIIEKIIDSWHMSIFSSYLKIISIKKNIFGNCHKLSISKNVHPISSDLFQKQKRECFISQTIMKSSLKTVHKVARHYSKNSLDCKRSSFLPEW